MHSAERPTRNPITALATQIYREKHAYLLAIARRNSATNEDAEEALQDAFILFIDHYDPTEGSPPLAWLTLTLKRRCWAIYKRQELCGDYQPCRSNDTLAATPLETRADLSRLPHELVEVAESIDEVRQQMKQLKPQERIALGLLGLGYSYKEIAELRDWSYTKVNRCIAEGRAALRRVALSQAELDEAKAKLPG